MLLIFKFCFIFLYYGNVRDCERGSEEAERGGSSSRNSTEKRGLEVEKKTTRSACFPFDRRLPCSLSRSLSLSHPALTSSRLLLRGRRSSHRVGGRCGAGEPAAAAEALQQRQQRRWTPGARPLDSTKESESPSSPFRSSCSLSAFVLALALSRREERGDTGACACE